MQNDTIINLIAKLIDREITIQLTGELSGETVTIMPLINPRIGLDCCVTFFSERFLVSLDPRKSFESAANIAIKICGAENAYNQLVKIKENAGK